jgi:PKD repeat protein
MALDGEGCVHVTGLTCSGDFPRTPGALNLSGGGLWNAFAARVNRLGNGLAHSALLGPGLDPKAVAVLGTSAAVAGTALGPADPSLQFSRQPAGGSDAFAMYLGESGEAVRATLLGGSGADSANAVAVGPDGRLHIAGETWSADFPRAGRQAPGLGGGDGFAARLDRNWTSLEYCTALGGTGPDAVAAMALSGNGCMHLAGCTWSSDLPVSALAHGTSAAGAGDGWSAALDMDAPRADAGPDLSVNESFALSFDGSRSTDNAAVVNYTWAVSDRDEDIILWGPAPNHTFREPGVYRVLLEVEDPAGNIDADEINVSVLVYPIPVAEAGPDVAADGQGVAVLDGSLSHDNVAVTDWTWSFDDGLNTVAASGERLEWRFRSPGTYVVNLTVSDADGNTDTDWMEITVADTACPIAALQASARVEPGAPVWLDASPSSDNEGIEDYIWSFSHNGTAVELRGMQASFEFWEPGNHTVLLTVRDRAGNEATNVMVVDVAAPGGGDAHISPLWALPALLAALAAALAYMLRGRGPGTGEVPP